VNGRSCIGFVVDATIARHESHAHVRACKLHCIGPSATHSDAAGQRRHHSSQESDGRVTKAELRYDAKAVDRLLDENFIYVGNDGSLISRIDFIRLTDRSRNPLDLLEITDVDVRTIGDTAIATALIHEKGLIDGRPYEFRGRTLTTLVRKSGRWYCLAIHD